MVDSRRRPTDVRSFLASSLDLLTQFLGKHRDLAEAHLADFIVDDLFTTLVPTDMRLNSDDDADEWFFMAASTNTASMSPSPRTSTLNEFVRTAVNCRLESLLLDTRFNFDDLMLALIEIGPNAEDQQRSSRLLQFDAYASHKKQHEVEMMADLVVAICHKQKTVQVVDIGSGKGYLSSFLALQHGLNVLGIDSSQSNIMNASKRNARLERSWSGLVERATTRAETGKPERKRSSAAASSSRATNNGSFIGITEWVDETTDLTALISTDNDLQIPVPFVLTALHTCGNLSARVLESYIREPACQSVVCVGCCYHLIDEQFCASPYDTSAGLPTAKSAFPMSSFLRLKEFSLGRNSRMLACEALHRIVAQQSSPCVTLFYRALLKVILRDKYGKKYDNVHVGRLTQHKLVDFTDYVRRALLKIRAPQQLSDSEISSYFDKYSDYERLLKHFCRLRSLLAPAIESVILLDRLCFLHEQDNVSSSYLVRMFDPVTSPRCHAIVSFKCR